MVTYIFVVFASSWQLYAEIEELRAVVARTQALERVLQPPPPPAAQHAGNTPGTTAPAPACRTEVQVN